VPKKKITQFTHVYIDSEVEKLPLSKRILAQLPGAQQIVISGQGELRQTLAGVDLAAGKKRLWLTRFIGSQVKSCPGTDMAYICCNYHVVNEATQCPLDCTYCILQDYVDLPIITIYVNTEDMLDQIQTLARQKQQRLWRIGSGELTDSLALDPLTGLSQALVARLGGQSNLLFELKSKTINTDSLPVRGPGNFVLAWSLNPETIRTSEELHTASIAARIATAAEWQHRGYLLAFHFDPLVAHAGWQANYSEVIDLLREHIDPGRIAWISLGALRYNPNVREIMRRRFPGSSLPYEEEIRGDDGKIRYPRPLRQQLFAHIYGELQAWDKALFVYFCMENKTIWQRVMGFAPTDSGDLDYRFHVSLYERFPELQLPEPQRQTYSDDRLDGKKQLQEMPK
jgi:spore photoproduct lyase